MNCYPLSKNEMSFLFIELNVKINLPRNLYTWRLPSWPKYAVTKYWQEIIVVIGYFNRVYFITI
jgi:hypothetical protein